ncbi:MAG: DUF5343 domain-containing protein [Chloroflexota bacterium]|nr:DUF5343 domain-containing protein [Chloroflexota bacterium]
MTQLTDHFAPYAPVSNVTDAITRRRDRGLPSPVTNEVLESIGIPPGNSSRTLQALRFLGLIDDENMQTDAMERIARASSSEYEQVLASIVRNAYGSVFTIVDPTQDDETAVNDAFRQFTPPAQRERMVTLFLGLCREAGMAVSQTTRRRASERRRSTSTTQRAKQNNSTSNSQAIKVVESEASEIPAGTTIIDYRLISAIVNQLPGDGKWSSIRRERWLSAMTAAVDLIVELEEESAEDDQ